MFLRWEALKPPIEALLEIQSRYPLTGTAEALQMLAPSSRGLKLNPKVVTEWKWNLVSAPIRRLYEVYWKTASDVRYDAEDNVTAFEHAIETGTPNPDQTG